MIGKMDEYLIHQIESTIDHIASTDINWQDRFYFNFIDRAGSFAGLLGYGVFPNRNVQEGAFRAVYENRLYGINFSRELDLDRDVIKAGSLFVDILEPMQKWSINLSDKDIGVNLDLRFSARNVPYEFEPIFYRRNGQVVWNQVHYTQAGTYTGSLTLGGNTIKDFVGIRDRSWGLRNMRKLDLWIWISANFKDYWLTAWHAEDAQGNVICSDGTIMFDGSQSFIPFMSMDHDIKFELGKRTPKAARYVLTDMNEKKIEVRAKALTTIFIGMRPGLVDLSDPAQLEMQDKGTGLFDQIQEFHIGDDVGYGITEFLVIGGSEKYKDHWTAMRPR